MKWLEQKMQDRLGMSRRLNKSVVMYTQRGAHVVFHPSGVLEISRPNSKTMENGKELPAWRREVETFAKCAGYQQYDLRFSSEGVARVMPL
jgi:hypothetical protein